MNNIKILTLFKFFIRIFYYKWRSQIITSDLDKLSDFDVDSHHLARSADIFDGLTSSEFLQLPIKAFKCANELYFLVSYKLEILCIPYSYMIKRWEKIKDE